MEQDLLKVILNGLELEDFVEIDFRSIVQTLLPPNTQFSDILITRALLNFDKSNNLDHLVILMDGPGPVAVRFWKKFGLLEELTIEAITNA